MSRGGDMLSQGVHATVMRGNLSVYALRIFVQIVQRADDSLEGTMHKQYLGRQAEWRSVNREFAIPIREILAEGSHDYVSVRNAAVELQRRIVQYYDTSRRQWYSSPMIYNVSIAEGSGVLYFSAAEWVIKLILDYTDGFNLYHLSGVMRLSSSYSIRLYMLMCGCKRQLQFSVPYLRQLLAIEDDQYKQTGDMIKRCLAPAAADLERHGLNGFTWEVQRSGRKIVGVILRPIKREEESREQVLAQLPGLSAIDPSLKQYLMTQCAYSSRELSANKATLCDFVRLPNWQDILYGIVERARIKRATKGYIINAMRSAYREGVQAGVITT